MRVIELQNGFGLDNLVLTRRPEPTAGPGEVLVRIRAASLNYRDLLMVKGQYNPRQPLPLIPVSDGAGEVAAVGEGVTAFKPGDRVVTNFAQDWLDGEITKNKAKSTLGGPLDGVMAEYRVFPQEGLLHTPGSLTDVQAATLPVAAVTAWRALVDHGRLKAGETVLLQGTGGVSVFALQLAKIMGARVIITSGSDEKLARAKQLGADEGINYRQEPNWAKRVLALTDGDGVDQIVEVGGAGTLVQSLEAITFGGKIHVIGILSGLTTDINLIPILMRNIHLQGIYVGPRQSFLDLNRAIAQNHLVPVVDRVFGFEELRAAFERMERGEHFGKICLQFD